MQQSDVMSAIAQPMSQSVKVSRTPYKTTAPTGTNSRRPRSAKARNRGRSGTRRRRNDYGDLSVSTVAKSEGSGLFEGRYGCDVRARRANSALKKGEKAVAARVETGDRVRGAVAGG
jgi:hypothetical protein